MAFIVAHTRAVGFSEPSALSLAVVSSLVVTECVSDDRCTLVAAFSCPELSAESLALCRPYLTAHFGANDRRSLQLPPAVPLAIARALLVADSIALAAAQRGALTRTKHAADYNDPLRIAVARTDLHAELRAI